LNKVGFPFAFKKENQIYLIKAVLKLQPSFIIQTAMYTVVTISVWKIIWKKRCSVIHLILNYNLM
jgi:hypothetical protein